MPNLPCSSALTEVLWFLHQVLTLKSPLVPFTSLCFPETWFWQDNQWIFPSFPSFKDKCEWLVPKLPSRSFTSFLASSRLSTSFLRSSRLSTSFSRFSSHLLKDPLPRGWRTHLWPKFGSSFFFYIFLSLSFFLGLWASMVLLNFTSWAFFC